METELAGGGRVTGQGLVNVVNVFFSVELDLIVPDAPVPEASTAVSAGCFALLGGLARLRIRRRL